jgi:predicted 3-demethylubiquinone-9 3-methyltransferase (glyoxalase superfamily)
MPKFLADPDREKAARVMHAMMNMVKLDIATLQAAYDGRS